MSGTTPPLKRYTRWSRTSAGDQNRLRDVAERLDRPDADPLTGVRISRTGGGLIFEEAEAIKDRFLIQITGGTSSPYTNWQEVAYNGTSFAAVGFGLTGAGTMAAREVNGHSVATGTICEAWIAEDDTSVNFIAPCCGDTSSTPSSYSADQNNLTLTTDTYQFISSTTPITITGIVPPPVGSNQSYRYIFVNVGSFPITFANQSGSSTAANRLAIGIGINAVILPGYTFEISYNPGTSRWNDTVRPLPLADNGSGWISLGTGALPLSLLDLAIPAGTTPANMLRLNGGTITTDIPAISISQTWNSGGTTFHGLDIGITNTASATASTPLRLQVGGTPVMTIGLTGNLTVAQGTLTTSIPGLTITETWNAGGTVFQALTIGVTNTASAAGSSLFTASVGGTPVFDVAASGQLTSASATASFGTHLLTLAGDLVTSGANNITLTTTGVTNITLPTSGQLGVANNANGTGTTTAAGTYNTLFDVSNAGGLTGVFCIKNTTGAGNLTYRIVVTDMFGTVTTGADQSLGPAAIVSVDINSLALLGATAVNAPFQEVKLQTKNDVAGRTWQYYQKLMY